MPKHIDVDELKEWVQNWFEKHRYYHPYSKTNDIPITELYDILEQIPPTDVRENVHAHLNKVKMKSGEWWHTCSKCIATWGSEDGELDFKFCPNCGAVMDERREDE